MKNYKNKDWLEYKYLNEKLSTIQISNLCSCNNTTIWRWLKKLNIPIRSWGDAGYLARGNHCNLFDMAKQWIDGELLGDGCLFSQSKYSACFQYSSKHREYIQYISDTLKSFGIKQSGKIRKYKDKRWNCSTYPYKSLSYAELLPIRRRWYPEGKKIIPRDLELTPLVLKQEHVGDGCLVHRGGGRPHIELATCGFTIPDVEWLVKKLNETGFMSTRQPADNTIHISTYSTKQFLDYIGKSPTKCYQYKFNYQRKI